MYHMYVHTTSRGRQVVALVAVVAAVVVVVGADVQRMVFVLGVVVGWSTALCTYTMYSVRRMKGVLMLLFFQLSHELLIAPNSTCMTPTGMLYTCVRVCLARASSMMTSCIRAYCCTAAAECARMIRFVS